MAKTIDNPAPKKFKLAPELLESMQRARTRFSVPLVILLALTVIRTKAGKEYYSPNNPLGLEALGSETKDESGRLRLPSPSMCFEIVGQRLWNCARPAINFLIYRGAPSVADIEAALDHWGDLWDAEEMRKTIADYDLYNVSRGLGEEYR